MTKAKTKTTQTTSEDAPNNAATEASAPDKPEPETFELERETAPDQPGSKEKTGGGGGKALSLIALIVAIAVFIVGYSAQENINQQQSELYSRLGNAEQTLGSFEASTQNSLSLAEAAKADSEALQGRVAALESKIDSGLSETKQALDSEILQFKTMLENELTQLKQSDSTQNDALSSLKETLKKKRDDDWLAAEARHLIKIATHQAQLNHNAKAAMAALEAADQRLRDAADPALLQVRQTLTDNIIALRGISELDITGIALTLNQLENRVAQLSFADKVEQPPAEETSAPSQPEGEETASGVEQFANRIWADIKGLVSVRHDNVQQSAALLPPGQQFFLQQNLRLKLETARLALLQRDTQTFQDTLATATQWLKSYFDTSTTAVANMINSLAPYENLDLQPPLPDISGSLRALDEWQQQRDGGQSGNGNNEEVSAL